MRWEKQSSSSSATPKSIGSDMWVFETLCTGFFMEFVYQLLVYCKYHGCLDMCCQNCITIWFLIVAINRVFGYQFKKVFLVDSACIFTQLSSGCLELELDKGHEHGTFYPLGNNGSHLMMAEGPGLGYNINVAGNHLRKVALHPLTEEEEDQGRHDTVFGKTLNDSYKKTKYSVNQDMEVETTSTTVKESQVQPTLLVETNAKQRGMNNDLQHMEANTNDLALRKRGRPTKNPKNMVKESEVQQPLLPATIAKERYMDNNLQETEANTNDLAIRRRGRPITKPKTLG
ncbi:hypothetical protein Tco_0153644 [Tanacetum coccineum]